MAPEQYVRARQPRCMYDSVGGAEELVDRFQDLPLEGHGLIRSRQPRGGVDELTERVRAGRQAVGDTDDYPFMYQRPFDDPDG